jgi:hypothetical protein
VQLRNSAPDLANARKLIALLVGQDGQDFVAHYQRLCCEAQILIVKRWHEIDAVAAALLEREVLRAMELHPIIRAALAEKEAMKVQTCRHRATLDQHRRRAKA